MIPAASITFPGVGTFRLRRHSGLSWAMIEEEPCPWCAIWVGAHGHSLVADNGEVRRGTVVVSKEQMDRLDAESAKRRLTTRGKE